jgi:hypothetical protein
MFCCHKASARPQGKLFPCSCMRSFSFGILFCLFRLETRTPGHRVEHDGAQEGPLRVDHVGRARPLLRGAVLHHGGRQPAELLRPRRPPCAPPQQEHHETMHSAALATSRVASYACCVHASALCLMMC